MNKKQKEIEEYWAIYNLIKRKKWPFEQFHLADEIELYGSLFSPGCLGLPLTRRLPPASSYDAPYQLSYVKWEINRIRRLRAFGLRKKDLPFSFSPLCNLEELSLSFWRSSGYSFDCSFDWSVLPKLRFLELSGLENLQKILNLDGLENLEVLRLPNFLGDDLFDWTRRKFENLFSGLTNLRVLDFRDTNFCDFSIFKSLHGLKKLEYVDLRSILSEFEYSEPFPTLHCKVLTGKYKLKY